MESENDRGRSFTRRAFIVGAMQGAFLAVLGGRLAWLQIAQGQRYKTLAENNRISIRLIAPARGAIVDRYGEPLAVNSQNFRAVVIPEQTTDLETALSRLQKLVPLNQRDIQRVLKQAERSAPFMPLEVKDNLVWDDVATVEVNLPDLPGVSIDENEIRHYPLGQAAVHLLGYVGVPNKAEAAAGSDPLLTLPGFMVGKTGLEKIYDPDMRGSAGAAEVEVNVVGRDVRELRRDPGQPGKKIVLTIDAALQQYVHERLAQERSASAVIVDVVTGAIYAMASVPGFDPNLFSRGLPADIWEQLLADPGLPLNNKAVSGQYPPGSTFKMVTAMAALEKGVISPSFTAFCPGHYDFGNNRFHCWKKGGHGTVDVVRALTESCDTFFYKVGSNLPIDDLAEYAHKLGLGARLALELDEERPGLIPTKAWKKGHLGDVWHPGETIVAAIGQGYTLTTPLQLAIMTARLVNGGKAVTPWIAVREGHVPQILEGESLGFKKSNIDLILKGMTNVVGSQRGTAYGSRIKDEGFEMGGKTGTAQVKRITKEERAMGVKNQDLPWKFRHHALFVGYAPVANPRYACCVVVEHGVGGGQAAAPIAKDALYMAQQLNPAAKEMTALRPAPRTKEGQG